MSEIMYVLVSMVIYNMVIIVHGNTKEQHLECLLKVLKLRNFLDVTDVSDRTCVPTETVNKTKDDFVKKCNDICITDVLSMEQRSICSNVYLNISLNNKIFCDRLYSNNKCRNTTKCPTLTVECNIKSNFESVKNWLLGEQESCAPCPTNIADLRTSTTTLIPTTATCKPCPVLTTEDKLGTIASSSDTELLHDRCGKDESVPSDCPGIAAGVGCVGIIVGVIITSTICICWSQRKQPRRSFEGQAMTNKAYFITGVEKNNDVESKPHQRSVIYSEINDDPTHGHPKVSHVTPIIRDTEGKTTKAPNDKNVYNHLNEVVNEDEADDYDHACPVPVQNGDIDNAYEKMAAVPKSIPDDKRISSSSEHHDYGKLEVVDTGVKRLDDNETKKMESDEDVGNEDNDDYFTLEKSQI